MRQINLMESILLGPCTNLMLLSHAVCGAGFHLLEQVLQQRCNLACHQLDGWLFIY